MKKNIIYFVLMTALFCSYTGFAQIKTADKLYERFAYSRAIPYYLKVINSKKDAGKDLAVSHLADCYRHINDYEQAANWYQKAVDLENPEPINYFYLGTVLRSMSRYNEAEKAFSTYADLVPADERGKTFAQFCAEIQKWDNNFVAATIKNKEEINSAQSDFSPVIHDGALVFTSDRGVDMLDNNNYSWTGNAYLDLYYSTPENAQEFTGKLSTPEKVPGSINQAYHDGPACFSSDNKKIFITRTYKSSSKSKKTGTNLLAIYYTDPDNKKTDFIPFPYNSNQYSVAHPALSPDGTKLIFSSDMPGGKGESDLYISVLKDGVWSTPENLGEVINTFGNEVFPAWADNSTLYFSSDSHMGYGGLDIYKTAFVDGKWSAPENLRSPINSSYDDFGITFLTGKKAGFFSSNRPGGKGMDDIYQFTNFKAYNKTDLNTGGE